MSSSSLDPTRLGILGCVLGGTALQFLPAAVGATSAAWAGPLALVAGAVASVGLNRLSAALDRNRELRDAAREFLTNPDIARVQARALEARLLLYAGQLAGSEFPTEAARLRALARSAHDWWPRLVSDPLRADLGALRDDQVATTLTPFLAPLATDDPPRPSPVPSELWTRLLAEADACTPGEPKLTPAFRAYFARHLADRFLHDLTETLKTDFATDGRAYAAVSLRYFAAILSQGQQLAHDFAELRPLLNQLPQLLEALAAAATALRTAALSPSLVSEVEAACAALPDLRDAMKRFEAHLATLPEETAIRVVEKLDARAASAAAAPAAPFHPAPRARAGEYFGHATLREKLTARLRAGAGRSVLVGPAGFGKTALAAEALHAVVPDRAALATSPYPDGILWLDLYTHRADLATAWSALADALRGPAFEPQRPADQRARLACHGQALLLLIEGAELFDGREGRPALRAFEQVLDPAANRLLILTRDRERATGTADATLRLEDPLAPPDDAALLRRVLSDTRPLLPDQETDLLALLAGHPLAITWTGGALLLDEHPQAPARLIAAWRAGGVSLSLSDPQHAEHTLRWLYQRSVAALAPAARRALSALGALAHAPVPEDLLLLLFADASARDQALLALRHRELLRRPTDDARWMFSHVLAYGYARQEQAPTSELALALAHALHADFATLLRTRPADALTRLAAHLPHAAALLDAAPEPLPLWPLADQILYRLYELALERGSLDLAARLLATFARWWDRLPASAQAEPAWQREKSVWHIKLGNVHVAQGRLDLALASFQQSKAIAERLAAFDPHHADRQRDLAVSLSKLGNIHVAQGRVDLALASFQQSKAIAERLAASDPHHAGPQRDFAVSLEKIGDLHLAQGRLELALASFEQARVIHQRLAASDPHHGGSQHDLSVALGKISAIHLAQGRLALALAAFEQAKAIAERLAASDPHHAGWQRGLCISHERLGDVHVAQGRLDLALASFEQNKAIAERLAASDPHNAGWQRDLSVSHERLGDVHVAQGRLDLALAAFEQAKAITERLAASDPQNAEWQRDLKIGHERLGNLLARQGRTAEAEAQFLAALALARRLVALAPDHARFLSDLIRTLFNLGIAFAARPEPTAVAEARALFTEALALHDRLTAAGTFTAQHQLAWGDDLRARLAALPPAP